MLVGQAVQWEYTGCWVGDGCRGAAVGQRVDIWIHIQKKQNIIAIFQTPKIFFDLNHYDLAVLLFKAAVYQLNNNHSKMYLLFKNVKKKKRKNVSMMKLFILF